jgi:hypothetical protein
MNRKPHYLMEGRVTPGLLAGVLAWLVCVPAGFAVRDRLYTKPDPASPGGIMGEVVKPAHPIRQVLAIPPDEPRLVYEGDIRGEGQRRFYFEGLPMRKYDLVVIYDDNFYEGLTLHRTENTLKKADLTKINETIQKAEPYFTKKYIHRVEGMTGRGNVARCICTFLRDRPSTNGPDYRRTFKLIMMKDVGPGWQVVRARDLFPVWTKPDKATPTHHYRSQLSRIRVTTRLKDLGPLNLAE